MAATSPKRFLNLPPSTITRINAPSPEIIKWRIPDFSKLTVEVSSVTTIFERDSKQPNFYEFKLYPEGEGGTLRICLSYEREDKAPDKTVMCYIGRQRMEQIGQISQKESEKVWVHAWTFEASFSLEYYQRHISVFAPSGTLTITFCLDQKRIALSEDYQKFLGLLNTTSDCSKFFHGKPNDVTIKVGDRDFQAHKAVLMNRSTVFSAMFRHDTLEKQTGVVKIDDCDPDLFQVFFNYLYTGTFKGVNPGNAVDLYVLSDKYNVQMLKSFCVKHMVRDLTVEKLFDMVSMAELFGDTELLSSVQEFFNRNFGKVISTARWRTVLKEEPEVANRLLVRMEPNIEIRQVKKRKTKYPYFTYV